jgi:SAM-dependent methyltransferase
MQQPYLQANQQLWNDWTHLHQDTPFYPIAAVKAGGSSLRPIERTELLPHVPGKTLLHLQCHFGLDTLSLARAGAIVTGVDFSDQSIAAAQALSAEMGLPATFVCSDVTSLADVLTGEFDIVFTSYGVLNWLPDLTPWAATIAHFLKPGGIFYMVEDHPFMRSCVGDGSGGVTIGRRYFYGEEPFRFTSRGSYAAPGGEDATLYEGYGWDHSVGEILNALITAGLHLEFFHEFPFAMRGKFSGMEQGEDGLWRLTHQHNMLPFLFSLQARKPIG